MMVSVFTKERDLIDLCESNQTVIWGIPVQLRHMKKIDV